MVKRWRSSTILAASGLASLVAICSCGNGSKAPGETSSAGSRPQVESTHQAQVQSTHKTEANKGRRIIAFGDSLTAGVAGKSYPEHLQDILLHNGYRYEVENQGVSGDTTTDGLARIENVIVEKPALVILEFGGNDGLRGLPVEFTRKNLEEMITRIQKAGIPLVLLGITLPPNYGPEYVRPFTEMFPGLAKKYKIPAIPFLLARVYQDPKLMQPDGIHPNGEGNRVVAEDVFQLISKMLKPA